MYTLIIALASPNVEDVKKRATRVTFEVADDSDANEMIQLTARLYTDAD